MTWSCHKHPVGRRYWRLDGTDYTIDTVGQRHPSMKSGASESRSQNSGYQPLRGRQALGLYSSLALAKARVERDIVRLSWRSGNEITIEDLP